MDDGCRRGRRTINKEVARIPPDPFLPSRKATAPPDPTRGASPEIRVTALPMLCRLRSLSDHILQRSQFSLSTRVYLQTAHRLHVTSGDDQHVDVYYLYISNTARYNLNVMIMSRISFYAFIYSST